MSRNTTNATRRKGPGPTTYKPARTDPTLLNPPVQSPAVPAQKPWNYNVAAKTGTVTGPTTSIVAPLPPVEKPKIIGPQKAPQVKGRPKPEWDPFFWKSEAQLGKEPKQPPNTDDAMSDIFENFPKFQELGPEVHKGEPSTWDKPQGPSPSVSSNTPKPTIMSPKGSNSHKSSDDISKPQWTNYHKWWESLLQDLPGVSGKRESSSNSPSQVGSSGDIRNSSVSSKPKFDPKLPSPPPRLPLPSEAEIPQDADEFVLGLADVSELVEFLLYKCSAEECLPMLPEVLQDLDGHFRSLVSKYLAQKKTAPGHDSSEEVAKGSDTFNINLLSEVTEMHKNLKFKNEEILKTNDSLLAEVENLKSQVLILQDMIEKQEIVEEDLRSKVKKLETVKPAELAQQCQTSSSMSTSTLQPTITINTIQLKVENEALKLMNTKLRQETELNNRILGILELNCLCQNYASQEQGDDVKGQRIDLTFPDTATKREISGGKKVKSSREAVRNTKTGDSVPRN